MKLRRVNPQTTMAPPSVNLLLSTPRRPVRLSTPPKMTNMGLLWVNLVDSMCNPRRQSNPCRQVDNVLFPLGQPSGQYVYPLQTVQPLQTGRQS